MKDLVHIRQSQGKTNFPPIHADKENEIWIGNRLKIVRRMKQILQRDRVESPVAVEALIVKSMDDFHLLLDVLHVNGTNGGLLALLDSINDLLHTLRQLGAEGHIPGIKGAHTLQACRPGKRSVIGGIPRHRDKCRPLASLGENSAIIIDGRIVRAAHGGEPLLLQNRSGGINQSPSHRGIIDRIKKSEKANGVFIVAIVRSVNDRGDTPDHLAVTAGNQRRDLSMLLNEYRFRLDQLNNATREWWREARIRCV